jgi:hypothetical protein
LDTIYQDDQLLRQEGDVIIKKYGWEKCWESEEMKVLVPKIQLQDSINLMKVEEIIHKYGWLGADVVGEQGNQTLWLVIQHSDPQTQEEYLPILREAVRNGKASASDLAYLEDRVALSQGEKQIYGSQIGFDSETQLYYVSPLEDPDNVDKRRADVGLPPLAYYVVEWQIKWDVEQYKKDLPRIEAMEKAKQK